MSASLKLTKRACDTAEPARGQDGSTKERMLWDADVKGFGLRVSPNGARSFILMYRAGKGRAAPLRKLTIGPFGSPWTVETARTEARRLLGEVAAQRDPAGERARKRVAVKNGTPEKDTVRAAVEEWLRRDQADNRTVGEVRRIMEREILPAWGGRALRDVRKRDILDLLDGIADRGARIAANRTLAHVRRLLNWCVKRDLIESSPAQHVEKPADEVSRDRVLDDGELVEVWRAVEGMPGLFAAGVRLLILTGARRSEIFEAGRDELVDSAIRLPAARSKNEEGRLIHLSAPAMAIIQALPVFANSRWLLTVNGKHPFSNIAYCKSELDRRMLAARGPDGAAMKPWRIHDLRRSCATGLQRLGVPLQVTEVVLGHIGGSRAGVAGIYNRYSYAKEASEALDAWGDHVMRLLDPTPAKVLPMSRSAR